jgi:hypothetical protein
MQHDIGDVSQWVRPLIPSTNSLVFTRRFIMESKLQSTVSFVLIHVIVAVAIVAFM